MALIFLRWPHFHLRQGPKGPSEKNPRMNTVLVIFMTLSPKNRVFPTQLSKHSYFLWPIVMNLGVQYLRPKLKFYLFPLTRPTLKIGPTQKNLFDSLFLNQGCHTSKETKFPDISLTEFQISLTRDIMKLGSFCQFVKRFWELQRPLFKY